MSIRDVCGDNRSRQIPGGTDRESRRIYDRILFNIWIHPKRENVKRAESFPVKRKYPPRSGLQSASMHSLRPAFAFEPVNKLIHMHNDTRRDLKESQK